MSEMSLLPHTLRARLTLFIAPLVARSILVTGYFIGTSGRDTLLQEKQDSLLGLTRQLYAAKENGRNRAELSDNTT